MAGSDYQLNPEAMVADYGIGVNTASIRTKYIRRALGMTLPAQRGNSGYFRVTYTALTQTKTNLVNLILTKKGERVMQPEFGCDIHNMFFEQITDDIQANAKGAIQEAVQLWMPFVTINDVQLTKDEDYNRVLLTVVFSLNSGTNLTDVITLRL